MVFGYLVLALLVCVPLYFILIKIFGKDKSEESLINRINDMETEYAKNIRDLKTQAKKEQHNIAVKEKEVKRFWSKVNK